MYQAKILADSIGPLGQRLTTFEVSYPRFVHAEMLTHRRMSRNSASSRAIPVQKIIDRVLTDPVLPVVWGKNRRGMQASEELSAEDQGVAVAAWLQARDDAVAQARKLGTSGAHKQIVNRLLEPWMWITVIISATEYQNFFQLRCSPLAQPEIQRIADLMRALYVANQPKFLNVGEWHLPMVTDQERAAYPLEDTLKMSAARCARVSYLTHDGRSDLAEEYRLHDLLVGDGHWSPLEHQAVVLQDPVWVGNFFGFRQYRKHFPNEAGRLISTQ